MEELERRKVKEGGGKEKERKRRRNRGRRSLGSDRGEKGRERKGRGI